ncbi:MAG: glycosyltransferase family 2 protein [Thermodesulfobacteriota bacterium]|jgi:GT2 family glycosyltransferase
MTKILAPQQPDLSVIIVNYNTADLLQACLRSVQSQTGATFEVFVVDNASADDSVTRVKKNFSWVDLIESPVNLGFAKANNQAIHRATGRYLYFLNPDTEVRPGCLTTMVRFMDSHPKVGMAGSAIVYPDGSPQSSVETRYPGERHAKGELSGLPGSIAWLLGASLIARSEAIAAVGGFDEGYFLYGEDIDLGLALRKKGWELGFIPKAFIVHWEGQSERRSLPLDVWKKKFAAETHFYNKHYSPATVRAIRRANTIQALWRIATLTLTLPFYRNKQQSREKLAKYRLALKVYGRG